MSDEQAPEDEEAIDVEIQDEVLPAPMLDFEKLDAEIAERKARMQAKGRGDIAITFTSWGEDLRAATNDQAISEAFNAQAQLRMADYEARGVGEIAKRHTLAAKILQGDFDLEE